MRVMKAIGPSGLCLSVLCCLALPAMAQQMSKADQAIYDKMVKSAGMDPAMVAQAQASVDNAQRWNDANHGVIRYHIIGVYRGSPNVIGGSDWIGRADVVDRVDIDLDWKLDESALVGKPVIQNQKSTVEKLRNGEPKCRPPVLRGDYEHFDLLGIHQGLGGALEMDVRTLYPPAEVAQFCTGSAAKVPASVVRRPEQLVVLSPVLFSMAGKTPNVKVTADRKSMITTSDGWTWIYTPSVAR